MQQLAKFNNLMIAPFRERLQRPAESTLDLAPKMRGILFINALHDIHHQHRRNEWNELPIHPGIDEARRRTADFAAEQGRRVRMLVFQIAGNFPGVENHKLA